MQIEWNGSTLHYNKTGQGSQHLLLFHGYGQDRNVFAPLCEAISAQYTCYSFDIPFHGHTQWSKGETPIEKEDWHSILSAFLAHENISEFALLGYSIGARFALATFESFPGLTKEIFFFAPDGISVNFWYSFASYPWASRKLFKSLIHKPQPFFLLSRIAGKLKLVNKKVLRFAEHEMKSESRRSTVYHTWVVTRRLRFDIAALAGELNKRRIPVYIVLGKYDPLINKKQVQIFLKSLHKPNLILLPSGHHRLLESVARQPQKVFYSGK